LQNSQTEDTPIAGRGQGEQLGNLSARLDFLFGSRIGQETKPIKEVTFAPILGGSNKYPDGEFTLMLFEECCSTTFDNIRSNPKKPGARLAYGSEQFNVRQRLKRGFAQNIECDTLNRT
jgi:hypothetical protein